MGPGLGLLTIWTLLGYAMEHPQRGVPQTDQAGGEINRVEATQERRTGLPGHMQPLLGLHRPRARQWPRLCLERLQLHRWLHWKGNPMVPALSTLLPVMMGTES